MTPLLGIIDPNRAVVIRLANESIGIQLSGVSREWFICMPA